MDFFKIKSKDPNSSARTGQIRTSHGIVKTPVFMPVGTKATVKAMDHRMLYEMGCNIILGNLYHLYLQPGIDIIKKAGGLHKFMNWEKSILTDSGGFQVFSLDKIRKINDDGVHFKSVIDGSSHFFNPEDVIKYQSDLGSDIIMVLDECIPFNEDTSYTVKAAERTLRWAEISLRARDKLNLERLNFEEAKDKLTVFGIVQGGFIKDVRRFCARSISQMDFEGIAIGGLSVGEKREITMDILGYTSEYTDKKKPLYFMGLGDPEGILDSIFYGVDMFDCVLPTRISRMGSAFTSDGKINIKNSRFSDDFSPIDNDCCCYTCKNFSKSYIKHLYKSKEILSAMLLAIHNLHFLFDIVEKSRIFIEKGSFTVFREEFKARYSGK